MMKSVSPFFLCVLISLTVMACTRGQHAIEPPAPVLDTFQVSADTVAWMGSFYTVSVRLDEGAFASYASVRLVPDTFVEELEETVPIRDGEASLSFRIPLRPAEDDYDGVALATLFDDKGVQVAPFKLIPLHFCRPEFEALILRDAQGRDYQLPRTDPYRYSAKKRFPVTMSVRIVTPVYGGDRTSLSFGNTSEGIRPGGLDWIPVNGDLSGEYEISFDLKTFRLSSDR